MLKHVIKQDCIRLFAGEKAKQLRGLFVYVRKQVSMQEINANQQFSIPKRCKGGCLKEEKREEAIDGAQIWRPSAIKGTHEGAQRLVAHVCLQSTLYLVDAHLSSPDIGGYRSAGRVPREPDEFPLQTTPTSSSQATSGT